METLSDAASSLKIVETPSLSFLCSVTKGRLRETFELVVDGGGGGGGASFVGHGATGVRTMPGGEEAEAIAWFPRANDETGFMFVPSFEGIATARHVLAARLARLAEEGEATKAGSSAGRPVTGEVSRVVALRRASEDEEGGEDSTHATEVSMWSGLALGVEGGSGGKRRGSVSDEEEAEAGIAGTLATLRQVAAGKSVVVCVAAAAADRIALVTADLSSGKVLYHGTSTRYVTRRGQGGSQATADARKTIKSAGAQLRRAGAAALAADAERLLRDSGALEPTKVALILTAGAGATSRRTFVRGGSATHVSPSDPRLRRLPFGIAKPTYAALVDAVRKLREARRSHTLLRSVPTPATTRALAASATDDDDDDDDEGDDDDDLSGADALAASGALSFDGRHPLVAALADEDAGEDECVSLWKEYLAEWVVGWEEEEEGGSSDESLSSSSEGGEGGPLFSSPTDEQWAHSLVRTAPLHLAWLQGRTALFDLMVADIEALAEREDRARVLNAVSEDMDFGTALHALCASNEGERAVRLLRAGADPTIKTVRGGRVAAKLLTDDTARLTLRRYAAENAEERWEWKRDAAIAPLVDEATAAARAKRAAKGKANAAEQASKAAAKAKAKDEAKRAAEHAREQRRVTLNALVEAQRKAAAAMGPRDAARLAATRRFDGVPKCTVCRDADLPMVPYEVVGDGGGSVCSVVCAEAALKRIDDGLR
jgi:hypothetical protein